MKQDNSNDYGEGDTETAVMFRSPENVVDGIKMAEKSKILLIGGTGYIGKFIVEASAKSGHPTYLLVRESTLSNPSKSSMLDSFKNAGVTFITGDLYDHESLVKAIKQVDVVISTVGPPQFGDQVKIIAAIKESGNVKKFYPSEFGNDVDRTHAMDPAKTAFATKAQIRRAIEAEGIPHTYLVNNCFNGFFLPRLAQPDATAPPRDKVVIFGDGDTKESPAPLKKILSIWHSVFVKGDQTNFEIEPLFGVEASALYPDVKCTTVDEYLNRFI